MIVFDSLKWKNWFSYGDENKIVFTPNKVTQLIGKVGAGKSSIPLIIQEILYGKNSKGIKKGNIKNRKTTGDVFAELLFRKDKDHYAVLLTRRTSLRIQLYKNGIDISEHTAPNTYKLLEEILGLDFTIFSQLTYQSSKTSLEFLTSTDTNRKKFLISLFSLDKYVQIFEGYKVAIHSIEQEIARIDGSMRTILQYIDKNEGLELEEMAIESVPELPSDLIKRKEAIISELQNIDTTNSLVLKNSQYKEMLEKIDVAKLNQPNEEKKDISSEKATISDLLSDKRHIQQELNKIGTLKNVCHVCNQSIDISDKLALVKSYKDRINNIEDEVAKLGEVVTEANLVNSMWSAYMDATREFEQLSNYIDNDISDTLLDKDTLSLELAGLANDISEVTECINTILVKNKKAEINNAQVKLISEQLIEYHKELVVYRDEVSKLRSLVSDLAILKDIFGTKGLVNYKIQYLVSDLQNEISKYLEQLSSGRFQLEFQLIADKLNIVIYDGQYAIDIEALSSGEMSQINIATLLAIRSIMSSISNTKLNILFLDEAINTLDMESREALIDCLLEENDLNIFLMSHNYSHPLVSTINIVKENGISRLEYST